MYKPRILSLCGIPILSLLLSNCSLAGFVLIDDFSLPNAANHVSAPGESRAAFPPGTSGGSIIPLSGGSNIALDRGLFGATNSLVAGGHTLELSIQSGFVEFDWDVDGFDFAASGVSTVVWRDLTNLGTEAVSLQIELFQTFNGTDGNVGTGVIDVSLGAGETQDVAFDTVGGDTDFLGFRLSNGSTSSFSGRLGSVAAVPEPSSALTALGGFVIIAFRRRRTAACY